MTLTGMTKDRDKVWIQNYPYYGSSVIFKVHFNTNNRPDSFTVIKLVHLRLLFYMYLKTRRLWKEV